MMQKGTYTHAPNKRLKKLIEVNIFELFYVSKKTYRTKKKTEQHEKKTRQRTQEEE